MQEQKNVKRVRFSSPIIQLSFNEQNESQLPNSKPMFYKKNKSVLKISKKRKISKISPFQPISPTRRRGCTLWRGRAHSVNRKRPESREIQRKKNFKINSRSSSFEPRESPKQPSEVDLRGQTPPQTEQFIKKDINLPKKSEILQSNKPTRGFDLLAFYRTNVEKKLKNACFSPVFDKFGEIDTTSSPLYMLNRGPIEVVKGKKSFFVVKKRYKKRKEKLRKFEILDSQHTSDSIVDSSMQPNAQGHTLGDVKQANINPFVSMGKNSSYRKKQQKFNLEFNEVYQQLGGEDKPTYF